MNEYDFFDTPITPYTILQEMAEVNIHVRSTDTMEHTAVKAIVSQSPDKLPEGEHSRLYVYGRLGEKIASNWYIHVIEELDEAALSTDHELAQSQDMEQSLGSAEKFKQSRYRKAKED